MSMCYYYNVYFSLNNRLHTLERECGIGHRWEVTDPQYKYYQNIHVNERKMQARQKIWSAVVKRQFVLDLTSPNMQVYYNLKK